jgi:anti-sigma28 factor (negative regulator of flagellin synthesis)
MESPAVLKSGVHTTRPRGVDLLARPGVLLEQGKAVPPMNPVNNVGSTSPLQKIVNKPVQKELPLDGPRQLPASDKLDLSGVSHLIKALKSNADVRTDKVAAIKAQIEAGTYEDDKKLDAAVDKLLDELMR